MTTLKEAQAAAAAKRLELEVTLDRIEDKVNLPKKARKAYGKVQDSYVENPYPWIAGFAGVVIATVGVAVWLIVKDD